MEYHKDMLVTIMGKTISLLEDKITFLQNKVEDLELALTSGLTITKSKILNNLKQSPNATNSSTTNGPKENPAVFSRTFVNGNRYKKRHLQDDSNTNTIKQTIISSMGITDRTRIERIERFPNALKLPVETVDNRRTMQKSIPLTSFQLKKNCQTFDPTLFKTNDIENSCTKKCSASRSALQVDVEKVPSLKILTENVTNCSVSDTKHINDNESHSPTEEDNIQNVDSSVVEISVEKSTGNQSQVVGLTEIEKEEIEIKQSKLTILDSQGLLKSGIHVEVPNRDEQKSNKFKRVNKPNQNQNSEIGDTNGCTNRPKECPLDTFSVDQLRELMVEEGLGRKLKMISSPQEMRDILADHFRQKIQRLQVGQTSRIQPSRKSKTASQKTRSS